MWGTAADIYRIGTVSLTTREAVEKYNAIAESLSNDVSTLPYGHAAPGRRRSYSSRYRIRHAHPPRSQRRPNGDAAGISPDGSHSRSVGNASGWIHWSGRVSSERVVRRPAASKRRASCAQRGNREFATTSSFRTRPRTRTTSSGPSRGHSSPRVFACGTTNLPSEAGRQPARKIDAGLKQQPVRDSGLSHAFFAKNWPQYELDGLVTREMTGEQVILPLWHRITKNEVLARSPSLVDKLARNTSDFTVEEIATEIAEVINGSHAVKSAEATSV